METRASLWHHPGFLRLWAGQTVSSFGTMFGALMLTALVYLDATPGQMGLLAMAQGVPVLLFTLFAGVWIDRVRRRPIMIAADLGRAVLLLTIPVAAVFDALYLEQLYAVAFLVSALGLGFDIAYRSFLPSLVEREDLVEGNSKLSASESIAEVASPAAGGAVVQVAGGPIAVVVDALTFVWSAACVWSIKAPEPPPPRAEGRSVFADVLEGLGIVWRDRVLRAMTGAAATSRFFGGFWQALYAVFLIRELGFSPFLMGVTVGAGGIGSLAGALLAGRMTKRFGYGGSIITSKLAMILLGPLIPLAGGPMELAFAIIVLAQLLSDPFWATYEIATTSLRQEIAPGRALGRVNSTLHVVQAGLEPVGALVAGLLAEVIGVREALWVAVAGGSLAIVWLLASPIRGLTAPTEASGPAA